MDLKVQRIRNLLEHKPEGYLKEVRQLCISPGGLVKQELRKEVWPLLLKDVDIPEISQKVFENEYTDQIEKDVNRSLQNFDIVFGITEQHRDELKAQLNRVLNAIYYYNTNLHYYQGYHDIVSVFLLVGGEEFAFRLAYQCAHTIFKYPFAEILCMGFNFDEGLIPQLQLIYTLLKCIDLKTYTYLSVVIPEFPMFAVSWVLTWFSHDLLDFNKICRVFDFMLSTHILAPLYLSTAVIISQRAEIIHNSDDIGYIHSLFSGIVNDMNIEDLIQSAIYLMNEITPLELSQGIPRLEMQPLFSKIYNDDHNLIEILHQARPKNRLLGSLYNLLTFLALIVGILLVFKNIGLFQNQYGKYTKFKGLLQK